LFNVAAARTAYQTISAETLQLSPAVNYEEKILGLEAAKLHRLTVEPCEFRLQYTATIELRHERYDISALATTASREVFRTGSPQRTASPKLSDNYKSISKPS
jgi:hypothetical protein